MITTNTIKFFHEFLLLLVYIFFFRSNIYFDNRKKIFLYLSDDLFERVYTQLSRILNREIILAIDSQDTLLRNTMMI